MSSPFIGPFEWVDQPAQPTVNQPPPVPTFTDGQLVHQGDLNALVANLEYLQDFVLGGSQGGTAAKPMTVLSAITPNVFTSGAATLITFDTVLVDNVGAFDGPTLGDYQTVTVQKEGFYRIYFQCGSTAPYGQYWDTANNIYVLVNGSDVVNNSVVGSCWVGNQGNVEITVPLADTASIQVAYEFDTAGLFPGISWNSTPSFGGCRLEVEWVAPTIPVSQTTAA